MIPIKTMGKMNMQAINYKGKQVCCCHLLENAQEGSLQHQKNVVHIRIHQSCPRFHHQPNTIVEYILTSNSNQNSFKRYYPMHLWKGSLIQGQTSQCFTLCSFPLHLKIVGWKAFSITYSSYRDVDFPKITLFATCTCNSRNSVQHSSNHKWETFLCA